MRTRSIYHRGGLVLLWGSILTLSPVAAMQNPGRPNLAARSFLGNAPLTSPVASPLASPVASPVAPPAFKQKIETDARKLATQAAITIAEKAAVHAIENAATRMIDQAAIRRQAGAAGSLSGDR